MAKFEQYNIVLKDLTEGTRVYEFDLDDTYFKKIDSPEVQSGNVNVKLNVQKKISVYELHFTLDGNINIPCDRCLDNMVQPIHHKDKLQVKLGTTFSEEDEIVIVPEADGAINIAWFLYEFIVLNIPLKHVHAPGECNKIMVSKLKKHISRKKFDDDEDDDEIDILEFDENEDFSFAENQTDPRWDGLQNIDIN